MTIEDKSHTIMRGSTITRLVLVLHHSYSITCIMIDQILKFCSSVVSKQNLYKYVPRIINESLTNWELIKLIITKTKMISFKGPNIHNP